MFLFLLVAVAVFAAGGVLGALATVAAGVRAEQRGHDPDDVPRSVTAARWLVGAYVRRAAEDDETDDARR